MNLKIIKTAADHAAALAEVEKLMDAEPNSPAEERLELWALLIEGYEAEHFPMPQPDPVDAILFRMDQMGLSRTDLQQFIPSKSKVSEVLSRKRPLSLPMIHALHDGLRIPAEVLIRPAERNRRGKGSLGKFRTAKADSFLSVRSKASNLRKPGRKLAKV